jgi:hypothetical protein
MVSTLQKTTALGPITPEVISNIREWLAPNLRARVLADTETAAGWVSAALRQIAGKETTGARARPTV